MKRLIFMLCVFLAISSCSQSNELKTIEIQKIADNLLISTKFNVKIQQILPVIDDIQVVVLEMPYREFPSVILIKKDIKTNKWIRTFECLSPGIQPQKSDLLDWHSEKCGVDFTTDKETNYSFQDQKMRKLIESTMDKNQGVFILYQNFIHLNTSDSINTKHFDAYTIDKTLYFDFANDLFENEYKKYPKDNCMMYDTPKIIDCKFEKNNGIYEILCKTDNSQLWVYSFKGIDNSYRYLLDKKINVQVIYK